MRYNHVFRSSNALKTLCAAACAIAIGACSAAATPTTTSTGVTSAPAPQLAGATQPSLVHRGVLYQADPRGNGFIALAGRHYFDYKPDTGPSWVLPKCSGPIIFYASLATEVIKMFPQSGVNDGPCGKLTGKSGLYLPQGLFVDAHDNLWVANSGEKNILEFAPGAISPELTLIDPAGEPAGVAVDNNNGTVYVTNLQGVHGAVGNIQVYASGSTEPTGQLSDPNINNPFYVAVDNVGNVYVTYDDTQGVGQIDEWLGGAGSAVNLNVALGGPGPIMTTKSGALLVCDQGVAICGEFKPGSGTLSDTFGQGSLDPIGLALNRRQTTAFTNDIQFGEIDGWTYPGPDSSPLFTINVGVDGGEAIDTRPAPPNGAPY